MSKSIQNKILNVIYGNGRGWVFSQNDFSHLGSRSSIDTAMHRLVKQGTIRRIIRGIYDYPRYSKTLDTTMSPDIEQVAAAIARKFGWRIQVSGASALNILGLSTQVPARVVYLSDGPDRSYQVGSYRITFKHTVIKEAAFKLRESNLIVQAFKSIGSDNVTDEHISTIRKWLNPDLRSKVLKDTRTAIGWVYDAIRKICREDD
ncbi:hypothetical protein JXA40_11725 [bacterium]|nr:hypothetical protein [candidate division CSSED10-310 bacterium]